MATTKVRRASRAEFLGDLQKAMHNGNAPMAVALTDLDGFAELNEAHGVDAGDRVLDAWERVLQANAPKGAVVVRLGGDEYAVMLPGLSAENALVLVDEIRSHFSEHGVDGVEAAVSASAGIASQPPHGSTADELFRAAGEALMRAKRDGRDRVAIFVEEKMTLKSNYYSRANLDRLAKLSTSTARTEASLLREALDDLLEKYRDQR